MQPKISRKPTHFTCHSLNKIRSRKESLPNSLPEQIKEEKQAKTGGNKTGHEMVKMDGMRKLLEEFYNEKFKIMETIIIKNKELKEKVQNLENTVES